MRQRVVEIDLLRTVAIIMMVIYHTAFDLRSFYSWDIDLFGRSWEVFRVITVSAFLLASGVSSQLSRRQVKRALTVLSFALLVSIGTYAYDPQTFIYFGILHCIGFGLLLLIPLRKLKELNIPLGLLVLFISTLTLPPTPYSLPPTLDYYPLFPWVGLMMIGAGFGHFLYIRNSFIIHNSKFKILALPGRHALLIYMIHQPILLGILYAVFSLTP
jgi:uncharacterized membrane protein